MKKLLMVSWIALGSLGLPAQSPPWQAPASSAQEEHEHEGEHAHPHDDHEEKGDPIPKGHIHDENCGHEAQPDPKDPNMPAVQGYMILARQGDKAGLPTRDLWRSGGFPWALSGLALIAYGMLARRPMRREPAA